VRAEAEDAQFAGDQHFGHKLLVSAALKIRAGVNVVPAGPARRSKECIQPIGVGTLVSVGNDLPAILIAIAIGDSPFYDARIEWNFEFRSISVNVGGTESVRLIEGL
jgi:hypothetical protein